MLRSFIFHKLFIVCAICIILGCTSILDAQKTNLSNIALKYLLNLNIYKADSTISLIQDDAEKAYLNHYSYFIDKMVLSGHANHHKDIFKSTVEILSDISTSDKYAGYLSEVYLQNGIIEYTEGNSTSAVISFFKAYNYWEKSRSQKNNQVQNLKLNGIFNLLIGNLPEPYKNWAAWFGYKGNSDAGFLFLRKYINECNHNEAQYNEGLLYLAFAHLKFNTNNTENFITKYCSSDLYTFTQSLIIRCAFKVRKPHLCSIWLNEDSSKPIILYLQGKNAVLHQNNSAENLLQRFTDTTQGDNFVADAHRHLSWYYLISGDTLKYIKEKQYISQLSVFPTYEDKQARYESNQNGIPDIYLVKARMLFDCGQYLLAKEVLLQNHNQIISKKNSILEYEYRLGRCFQLLENTEKALQHYQAAINAENTKNRYFAPYAAIYSAKIYLQKQDSIQAELFLEKAQLLNDGESKNEIKNEIKEISKELNL